MCRRVDGGASEAEELTACKEFCLRAGWVASRRALFDDAARIVLSRPTDRVVEGESAAMAMLRVSVDTRPRHVGAKGAPL